MGIHCYTLWLRHVSLQITMSQTIPLPEPLISFLKVRMSAHNIPLPSNSVAGVGENLEMDGVSSHVVCDPCVDELFTLDINKLRKQKNYINKLKNCPTI